MFEYFTATLPHFLAYFGAAILLAAGFLAIYTTITPHRELALIREGNEAAAYQLVGSFLGFAIPVAAVIGHSESISDMLMWGALAAVIQLAVFFIIARLLFRAISQRISEKCAASGIFVGGISLGVGILQSGCMVP